VKVLHIIDTLWQGGAQSLLRSLFEKQKDNPDIFLFPLRTREFNIDIDHPNVLANDSVSRLSLKPLKTLTEIIKSHHIDILHCHLPRSHVFGYLIKKFYFPQIRLVIHEHGEIFEKYLIYKPILRCINPKVALFICVSKASENELKNNINIQEGKTAVLYNFIDTGVFNRNRLLPGQKIEREKHDIAGHDYVVGFAGRLFHRKGWREFISAAYLLKGNEELKFIIAGTGKDRQKLIRSIHQSGMSSKVIYLGYVKDMLWFYSLIDCLVIPSHWEGLPVTQLEARALGIPVITSNGPGLNEIQDENILMFENRNPADLASKISLLFNDKSLRLKHSNLPDLTNTFYSVNRYIEKLDCLYINLS